ncbi:hypothetical protein EJ02DRAFT_451143 [Clathrospora elynae]|uniref:Serine hydrolase domain-containing protein n=1 Tax=Clathrospora elynae TaxID=706981 RepID=A0A6A5SZB3_9PLEO|nr:hypothetical protein EJ02DRAFT_451143 [Clathrospora elynae]
MAAPHPNSTYMTPATLPKGSAANETTAIKPTLLAFHGSGSNATIHMVQLARLMRAIKPHFSVESLEAPFPSPAGPGILPFFDGCGPFKRWVPSSEKVTPEMMRVGTSTSTMALEVEELVRQTVRRVRGEGGRVVGLIGFSQGTKVVAGLLQACEIRRALGGQVNGELDWLDFSLALSVCASYPPALLPPCITAVTQDEALLSRKIGIPTFHVQGKQDEWHWAGKRMIEKYYEVGKEEGEGKSVLREWEMGHHYPVPLEESEEIGEWMVGVLRGVEGGVAAEKQ